MKIKEIQSKTILTPSKILPYTINPYVGCQHACSYCYARFMKRFTSHSEPWGEFVDVKINAPELLKKEILKKKKNTVWISGVCDPYQPLEKKYQITRQCLEILIENNWPIMIQTRSPLILRDINLLKKARDLQVTFSITTADDQIKKIFEPKAPPIPERIKTLTKLHESGIKTGAMIAPVLPKAENLMDSLTGIVDEVLVDKMNYTNADSIYKKYHLEEYLSAEYFSLVGKKIKADCLKAEIKYQIIF